MNNNQLISLTLLLSFSPFAMAAGKHDDGHSHNPLHAHEGHWSSPYAEANRENPIKATPASIGQGAELYQKNCASCHGVNAEGDGAAGKMLTPTPANLRMMAGQHPDGDFAYKIREGRGPMPGWKDMLNDVQVWHLVNFIQSLKGTESNTHGHHSNHGH